MVENTGDTRNEQRVQLNKVVSGAITDLTKDFQNLNVNGRSIQTPFWMNKDYVYEGQRYYKYFPKGGKMSPRELETRIAEVSANEKFDLSGASEDELSELLLSNGIGLDCSGFTYQSLKKAYEALGGEGFEDKVKGDNNLTGISKVGSRHFAKDENSFPVTDIDDVRPGDFIAAGRHLVVIIERENDSIKVAHITNMVQNPKLHTFGIHIKDLKQSVFDQVWDEATKVGTPYVDELRHQLDGQSGIRRLHIMDEVYSK